jgi:hypothetical protein
LLARLPAAPLSTTEISAIGGGSEARQPGRRHDGLRLFRRATLAMVGRVVGIPKIVCIVEIGMKVMNRLLHAAAVVLVSLVAFGFAAADPARAIGLQKNFAFTPAK